MHPLRSKTRWRTSTLGVVTLLVALLSVLGASGCSAASSHQLTPLPASMQTLRMGLVATVPLLYYNLDPTQVLDQDGEFLTSLIFPPLLTVNGNLQLEPWAAAGMPTFDAVNNTYTFRMNPNLSWSDGTPITAATFAYSLNRSLDPCTVTPDRWYLYPIKDAQAFIPIHSGAPLTSAVPCRIVHYMSG